MYHGVSEERNVDSKDTIPMETSVAAARQIWHQRNCERVYAEQVTRKRDELKIS